MQFSSQIAKIQSQLAELKRSLTSKQLNHTIPVEEFLFNSKRTCVESLFDEIFADIENWNQKQSKATQFLLAESIQQLERKALALIKGIQAITVDQKNTQYQMQRMSRLKNYKKAAQVLMQDSHQVYESLAQQHEYERRLDQMIREQELVFNDAPAAQKELEQKKLLALHQRLGRCRQATTRIEEQIQLLENKAQLKRH